VSVHQAGRMGPARSPWRLTLCILEREVHSGRRTPLRRSTRPLTAARVGSRRQGDHRGAVRQQWVLAPRGAHVQFVTIHGIPLRSRRRAGRPVGAVVALAERIAFSRSSGDAQWRSSPRPPGPGGAWPSLLQVLGGRTFEPQLSAAKALTPSTRAERSVCAEDVLLATVRAERIYPSPHFRWVQQARGTDPSAGRRTFARSTEHFATRINKEEA
jgi:hypothetical protein